VRFVGGLEQRMAEAGSTFCPDVLGIWTAEGQKCRHAVQQLAVNRRAIQVYNPDDTAHSRLSCPAERGELFRSERIASRTEGRHLSPRGNHSFFTMTVLKSRMVSVSWRWRRSRSTIM